MEPTGELVEVYLGGRPLARSERSLRVLETSHPPVYYIPAEDIEMDMLSTSGRSSWCEFKGHARYWDAPGVPAIGWDYPAPSPGYERLTGHVAFYAGRVRALIDGELVRAQPGDFYGGWITARVHSPFKGPPGTSGW